MSQGPISWTQTLEYLREDKIVFKRFYQDWAGYEPRWCLTYPSYLCVVLYRISHFFYMRGQRVFARLFWHINLLLNGIDIAPITQIGPGLFVAHPCGTVLVGKIGRNCFLHGQNGLGGGRSNEDIGAGPGLPVLGDDLEFGFGAFILGSFRVGDRVKIGPRCFVSSAVEDDTEIQSVRPIVRAGKAEVNHDAG